MNENRLYDLCKFINFMVSTDFNINIIFKLGTVVVETVEYLNIGYGS